MTVRFLVILYVIVLDYVFYLFVVYLLICLCVYLFKTESCYITLAGLSLIAIHLPQPGLGLQVLIATPGVVLDSLCWQ